MLSEYMKEINVTNAANFIEVFKESLLNKITYTDNSILLKKDKDESTVISLRKNGLCNNSKQNMKKITWFNIYLIIANDGDELDFDVFNI